MDKYTNKPLPMAPLPIRSSSCKDMDKLLPHPPLPQRSSSLPRLPSTSADVHPASTFVPPLATKELRLRPATTYVPSHARKGSGASRISNNPDSLRLVESRSVNLELPLRTHSSLAFGPAQQSPPLRRKQHLSPLRALPPGDVIVGGLVLVSLQPPTRGTTPGYAGSPKDRKDVSKLGVRQRRKPKLGVKKKNRGSMHLSDKVAKSVPRKKQVWKGPKKVKRDSLYLYPRVRSPSMRQPIFYGVKRKNQADVPLPPIPEIPFAVLYKQILAERWEWYRHVDAIKEADEKREVQEFMAKTYPVPDHTPALMTGLRRMAAPRGLASNPGKGKIMRTRTTTVSVSDGPLTRSSPHPFPSHRALILDEEQKLKKRWWNLKSRKASDEPKKLKRRRLGILSEDELKNISAKKDAGLRMAGL